MPAAYLTPQDATTRLAKYGIVSTPAQAFLDVASDDLDTKYHYVGERYDDEQLREFPRSVTIRDDVEGEVPSNVLDWVALRAYALTEEDDPPIYTEALDGIMIKYGGHGKRSQHHKLMRNLLRFYRSRGGIITP